MMFWTQVRSTKNGNVVEVAQDVASRINNSQVMDFDPTVIVFDLEGNESDAQRVVRNALDESVFAGQDNIIVTALKVDADHSKWAGENIMKVSEQLKHIF